MREMIFSFVKVIKSINLHLIIKNSAAESSDDIFELGSNQKTVTECSSLIVNFFEHYMYINNLILMKDRQKPG